MKLLDLFCGLGGWTKGFLAEGFDCTGIDNNPKLEQRYPGKFILADLEDYIPSGEWDVITASPPCTEFSIAKKYAQGDQVEMMGLDLVYRAFNIIQILKPKYWILENVKGIEQFLGPAKHRVRYARNVMSKQAFLYGEFPSFGMFESEINHRFHDKVRDPKRRAEIPIQLSTTLARAIKEKQENEAIRD